MDDMKPYFVGPDTPLEISENVRYVFDLRTNNARLLAVARAAEKVEVGVEGCCQCVEELRGELRTALAAVEDLL